MDIGKVNITSVSKLQIKNFFSDMTYSRSQIVDLNAGGVLLELFADCARQPNFLIMLPIHDEWQRSWKSACAVTNGVLASSISSLLVWRVSGGRIGFGIRENIKRRRREVVGVTRCC